MTINYGIPVYHRCTVNVKSSVTEIIKPRLGMNHQVLLCLASFQMGWWLCYLF